MTSLSTKPVVPLSHWLAQTVRLTVFPALGGPIEPDTWWHETIGSEPESRTVKPGIGERTEEGPFGENARLMLTVNPLGVIEWKVVAAVPSEPPTDIPSAGRLTDLLAAFSPLLERWLKKSPASIRIGFGIHALLPVRDHREGYEVLGRLLPSVKIDPEGSSEFLYRINRRRSSTTDVKDLRINRLGTWNLLKMSVVAGQVLGAMTTVVNERYACNVILDVNTIPEYRGTFDPRTAVVVTAELQRFAGELLENGDIP